MYAPLPSVRSHQTQNRKLFNLCRLQAVTKVKENVLKDFLFAEDCALKVGPEPELQDSMDKFPNACENFVLTISIKETEVMHQPARTWSAYVEPSTLHGEKSKPPSS